MLAYTTAVIAFFCLSDGISGHGKTKSDGGLTTRGVPPQGTLHVTMLVFSGRPDPQWLVMPTHPNYPKIQWFLQSGREDGSISSAAKIPAKLGYIGLLVKAASAMNSEPELILGSKTLKLQELLLYTMPEDGMFKGIRDRVAAGITQGHIFAARNVLDISKSVSDAPEGPEACIWFEPGIIEKNNCYNYATNIRTDDRAIPGLMSTGKLLPKGYTGDIVKTAAVSDGLVEVPEKDVPDIHVPFPDLQPKEHLHYVALYVGTDKDGSDFHWYRLNSDKQWSEKPGQRPPTFKDANEAVIRDPRSAKRNSWPIEYKFICFMISDDRKVKIRGGQETGLGPGN